MSKKYEELIVKNGDIIKYEAVTSVYGRAEFEICPKWIRGRLRKVTIWPAQQPLAENFYTLECDCNELSLLSWTHKGKENPWAWSYFWCKEHKCMCIRVYVPPDTNKLRIEITSGLRLIFE